jgi:hypothetical protein
MWASISKQELKEKFKKLPYSTEYNTIINAALHYTLSLQYKRA